MSTTRAAAAAAATAAALLLLLLLPALLSPALSRSLSPIPAIGCRRRGHGHFADTCHDIHLNPDNRTLSASCATDGSMSRFKLNSAFNLDRHIVDRYDGQLEVVFSCASGNFPLKTVSCHFARYCENIRVDVVNGASANGTAGGPTITVAMLTADCSDSRGQLWFNQLDLNLYITNKKGKLQWACSWLGLDE